jgi:hypothetical protein
VRGTDGLLHGSVSDSVEPVGLQNNYLLVYTNSVPRRTKRVTVWICNVCGHEWQSEAGKPLRCAGCKSPYWDRPKPSAAKPIRKRSR